MSGNPHDGTYLSAGGDMVIQGSAIGSNASVGDHGQEAAYSPGGDCDIGVITVLSEETHAVRAMMHSAGHHWTHDRPGGLLFDEAILDVPDGRVKIVGFQSLDPGGQPVCHAFDDLTRYYAPAVVALTGIAGGIHRSVRLGDVILARDVICYDQRKEAPGVVLRRGASYLIPPVIARAINNLRSDYGEPCLLVATGPDGIRRRFRVHYGPIGSGEAVVARADSEITRYLHGFNEKTLAVETESAGLARAFYEKTGGTSRTNGWLALRGISDLADEDKNDEWHDIAAVHAAVTLQVLAPYLRRACSQ